MIAADGQTRSNRIFQNADTFIDNVENGGHGLYRSALFQNIFIKNMRE